MQTFRPKYAKKQCAILGKKVTEAHCLGAHRSRGLINTLCSHLKIRFKEKFRPKYA